MQMRVIRVISYEGNPDWLRELLRRSPLNNRLRTLFRKQGTVKELQSFELRDDEWLQVFVNREDDNAKT